MVVRNQTVLCIEEKPSLTRTVGWFLQAHGYDVLWAASGEEGLLMAEVYRPALTLLDVSLPDMDGEEVMNRLRTHTDSVVAASRVIGVMDKQTRTKTEPLSAAYYDQIVSKPVAHTQLRSRLLALLPS